MAFNYATAKTKLNNYLTAKVDVDAALAALAAVGPAPLLPMVITSSADYSTYLTAYTTWLGSWSAAMDTYNTAFTTMRSFEYELIYFMLPNEWVKFTNTGGGVLTYTWWVGYCPTDPIDPQNGPIANLENLSDPTGDLYSDRQFCIFSAVQPTKPFLQITKIPS